MAAQPVEHTSCLEILMANSIFGAMPPSVLEEIADVAQLASATRGTVLWRHGAEVDHIGIIESGFVKLVKPKRPEEPVVLELMGPNQVFGFLGLTEGTGCPLSAVAISTLSYYRLPKTAVMKVYEAQTLLRRSLFKRLTKRFRQHMFLATQMTMGQVEERIAAVLMMLAESYAREVDGTLEFQIPLTRAVIADMAATTTETTIRVFSKWQKAGWVSTDRQRITLLMPLMIKKLATS